MKRILTGYVVHSNRRHKSWGTLPLLSPYGEPLLSLRSGARSSVCHAGLRNWRPAPSDRTLMLIDKPRGFEIGLRRRKHFRPYAP